MAVEICKWFNNADCPVLLMVDDLANVWVDTNCNGELDLGEDWGYWKNADNSSFRYLNEVVLKNFPEVKTTFFVPVGRRLGMIKNSSIPSISERIDCDEETKSFFRDIHQNPKYEIAYHGTTHGQVGNTNLDFIQEWELFNSLEEAVQTIEYGKKIYENAIGVMPKGGKYCGYASNQFSDTSIDHTDFLWWCRYWNRGVEEEIVPDFTGKDGNPLTNYDVKFFGENNVIDIPSTVNGALLTGIYNSNFKSIKGIAKRILKTYLIYKKLEQIDYLLMNKLVISIQEHIAPSRDDGRRQSPNIFDDTESLKRIFEYLNTKNVWYCTGTELAKYVCLRENICITSVDTNSFIVQQKISKGVEPGVITVNFDERKDFKLVLPDQSVIYVEGSICNLPIQDGEYSII
ncbi:hypothetical protein J5Y03_07950 [Bacillus sp. RG28]|uniref:Uncharacterized protein n=1 Tax=Gottfriedia endophytica TaxID=2820819 RepID=A0A940NGS4_9BACI|nr:hypothetical protein [Gottfriedia endophytica]MBP0725124.1 hypothetical protein [Gottfriedia endophytica]